MISASTKRAALSAILFMAAAMPAYAHVGVGAAGFAHPLSGLALGML